MASEEVVDIIVDIEEKYHLDPEDSALTFLLFDLEVKEVPLNRLLIELAYDLGMDELQAKPIYDEIVDRILRPIATELIAYGVGTTQDFAPVAAAPLGPPAPATFAAPAPPAGTSDVQPAAQPMPAPAAPATPTTMPMPVSLYKDTVASEGVIPTAHLDIRDTGDISRGVVTPGAAQRAARIDLGIPGAPSQKEAEFKSVFVERTMPAPKVSVDYVPPQPALTPSMPDAPVPLGIAPAPSYDTPFPVVPSIEVVSIGRPEPVAAPSGEGLFGSLMKRIAPWHSSNFGKKPQAMINYAEPVPSPQAAPTPIADIPAPPAPQA